MGQIRDIDDQEFESMVLASDKPVLVDFWAEWCGPCKMIAPVLEELAAEMSEQLTIVKMNVDTNEVPMQQRVRGIPALYLFSGGKLVAKTQGALPKESLKAFIDENLVAE